MSMSKTLVLIRHAHRDTTRRELDNGLDEKGREQAKALRQFFTRRFSSADFKTGLWLASSPKLRCLETLTPLAKACDRPVDAHPDLDEGGSKEGDKGLNLRVQRVLGEWTQSKMALSVLCSHGDWIPLAVHQLLGLDLPIKKGSWLELEWNGRQAELKWYVPSFRALL
jgi:broad specificity phosphatase PhoE